MVVTYIVPPTLVRRAARILQPPEKQCFITGARILGNVILLTDLVPVSISSSSGVHVQPDPASVFRKHHELLAMGMEIEGQAHSHPGRSSRATYPSYVDLDTARRWETGSPFIGLIFSEGGRFFRVFNFKQRSIVHVYGCHDAFATEDPHLFRIPNISDGEKLAEDGQSARLAADAPAEPPGVVGSDDDFEFEGVDRRSRRAR